MERSKIFVLALCLASFLAFIIMVSGCVQQAYQPEFNFREQCVVYDDFCLNESCEGFVPSVSGNIKCTGRLGEGGSLTISFVDKEIPKQADRIFTSTISGGDWMHICKLSGSELAEVKGMPLDSLLYYCSNQTFHISCKMKDSSSDRAILQCGDNNTQQIVSRDTRGDYNIFYWFFWVGKQVDVVDPQTGEINQTAYEMVREDKSCQYIDPEFHSYNCGVPGVFVAIPQ